MIQNTYLDQHIFILVKTFVFSINQIFVSCGPIFQHLVTIEIN